MPGEQKDKGEETMKMTMLKTAVATMTFAAMGSMASAAIPSVFSHQRANAGAAVETSLANNGDNSTPAALTQVSYSQLSTTGLTGLLTAVPASLDDVNLAAGSAAVAPRLNNLTFGTVVAANTAATTAVVFVDFYNTVDPLAPGVVESNFIGGFGGTLTITATTASPAARSFTFNNLQTLATPINFTDDNIGVVITFANAAGTAYSTILSNLSSVPGVPTIGTSLTGVYTDAANDDFQQTDFSPTAGNLYLSMTTVSVPEPMSLSALAASGLLAFRRRRA
jgi:hypothetical protein